MIRISNNVSYKTKATFLSLEMSYYMHKFKSEQTELDEGLLTFSPCYQHLFLLLTWLQSFDQTET